MAIINQWQFMIQKAKKLSRAELVQAAAGAIREQHRCTECFACACVTVMNLSNQ